MYLVMHLLHKGLCIPNTYLNVHLVISPIQTPSSNINIPLTHCKTFRMVPGNMLLMNKRKCK